MEAPKATPPSTGHPAVNKVADLILHFLGHEAEALKKRLQEKRVEDKHLLADMRKALGQIQTWADRRYNAIHYSRRVRAKRGSKLAKLALAVSIIGVVWVIYFGLTESRAARETNNRTEYTEVSHVR